MAWVTALLGHQYTLKDSLAWPFIFAAAAAHWIPFKDTGTETAVPKIQLQSTSNISLFYGFLSNTLERRLAIADQRTTTMKRKQTFILHANINKEECEFVEQIGLRAVWPYQPHSRLHLFKWVKVNFSLFRAIADCFPPLDKNSKFPILKSRGFRSMTGRLGSSISFLSGSAERKFQTATTQPHPFSSYYRHRQQNPATRNKNDCK